MKIPVVKYDGISPQTFGNILYAALKNPGITRTQLASLANVSIMTAGKAADALIGSGILTEKKLPSERGRCSSALTPSENIKYIIADTRNDRLQLTVTDPFCRNYKKFNHYLIDSLTYEDNIRLFMSSLRSYLPETADICAYGVLCRAKHLSSEEHSALMDITGSTPDIFRGHREISGEYLCRKYPDRTLVYIMLSDIFRGMIVSNGYCINGRGYREAFDAIRVRSEKALIEFIVQKLSVLCSFIIPSLILIESDKYNITPKFLGKLAEQTKESLRFHPEEIPEFIAVSDVSLPGIAMTDMLSYRWAHAVANQKNSAVNECRIS